MWSQKHEKHVLYWNNSSLEKLVLDVQCSPVLQKNEFRNQKIDLVWLSKYFFVSSIWFDCRTQFMDWVRFSSIEFNWNTVWLGSTDYAELQIIIWHKIWFFLCFVLYQNQTNYLPIRLLSQLQTVVKPKPKYSNCLISFGTQLKTACIMPNFVNSIYLCEIS